MKKLLIVVDYQKDFVDGSLGFPGAETLAGPIWERVEAYRAAGDEVVFTMDTHTAQYLQTQEGKNLPVPHCIEGTEGWELYPPVKGQAGERVFRKNAFGSAELFRYLQETPFAQIELAGLVSSICVISNAVLAKTAQPETPVVVDSALTKGHDPDLHEAAMKVMAGLQIQIL